MLLDGGHEWHDYRLTTQAGAAQVLTPLSAPRLYSLSILIDNIVDIIENVSIRGVALHGS